MNMYFNDREKIANLGKLQILENCKSWKIANLGKLQTLENCKPWKIANLGKL